MWEQQQQKRAGATRDTIIFVSGTSHNYTTSIYDSCLPLPFKDSLFSASTSADQEHLTNGVTKTFISEGYSLAHIRLLSLLLT